MCRTGMLHIVTIPFRRQGPPPPRYGRPGYCYNSPEVVISTPVPVAAAVELPSEYQRVVVFKCNRRAAQRATEYFVDVPFGIFPGEVFRVHIAGEEHLVVCPEIANSGERIVVVAMESN